MFFSEEKNQKTFASGACWQIRDLAGQVPDLPAGSHQRNDGGFGGTGTVPPIFSYGDIEKYIDSQYILLNAPGTCWSKLAMDAPPDVIAFPVLLRFARAAYVRAIRAAQAEAGCDDIPRDGTYVIGAMANGAMPLSDVIEELGMSKQAAGQLVDTLVLRGYIDRAADPNDRRRLTLSLTERGRALAEATRSAIKQFDAALIARAGAENVATTRATLAAMHGLHCSQASSTAADPTVSKRLEGKRADDSVFQTCSMRNATFDDVNLAGSMFANVNLSGTTFSNVNLSGVAIDNANIKGLTIFGHDVQALIRAEIQRTKSA